MCRDACENKTKQLLASQLKLTWSVHIASEFESRIESELTVNMFQVWAACLCAVACSHAGWKGLSGEGLGGVSAQVLQVGHLDFH